MGKLLLRLVVKQIIKIQTKEPYLANFLLQSLRSKHNSYTKPAFPKPSAQVDGAILHGFLDMLKEANLPDQNYHSFSTKIKLIEIYAGINTFVNHNFEIRRENQSKQMELLEQEGSYKKLKLNQQQFVRKIIQKVFEGEQTYPYTNLTGFFKDSRSQQANIIQKQALGRVRPEVKQYIESALNGKADPPISKSYLEAYDTVFNVKELSEEEKVLESYINSRYILLDFDKTKSVL